MTPAPGGWPGRAGYTTILASVRLRVAAQRRRAAARARGLPAGVLFSSDFQRLTPGYWVALSGKTSSKAQADARTRQARTIGFRDAYTRCVSQGSAAACDRGSGA